MPAKKATTKKRKFSPAQLAAQKRFAMAAKAGTLRKKNAKGKKRNSGTVGDLMKSGRRLAWSPSEETLKDRATEKKSLAGMERRYQKIVSEMQKTNILTAKYKKLAKQKADLWKMIIAKNPARRRNKTIITKPKKVIVLNPRKRNAGSWKDSKVTWAVGVLMEMAEKGDIAGIERFSKKAYADWAKGSNDRKDELWKGEAAALKRAREVAGQKNPATKSTRSKYRNGYLDLVIMGHAKKTPDGWSLGGKTFKQGKGIVPASRRGYFLDKATGTVFSKKARNVAQGAFYGGSFHPYRSSDDYDEGRAGTHTRSKKKRASLKKAIRTSTDKAETRKRKSTTSRLASRSLSRSVSLKAGSRLKNGIGFQSKVSEIAAIVKSEGWKDVTGGRLLQAIDTGEKEGVAKTEMLKAFARAGITKPRGKKIFEDWKYRISGGVKGKRMNPLFGRIIRANPSVKEIRKTFAGTVGKAQAVFAPIGTPKNVAKLGTLKLIDTENAKITPRGTVYLCADTKGKLHIVGSKNAPIYDGPAQNFGKINLIEYDAAKPHLYPGQGTIRFWHKLGEESGNRPTLYGDGKGGLKIKGGSYSITREGIRD